MSPFSWWVVAGKGTLIEISHMGRSVTGTGGLVTIMETRADEFKIELAAMVAL